VSIQKGERMATIRKLKSGRWQVSIRKGNHKAIYKTFTEKAVARKWSNQIEHQIERDVYTDYGDAETITIKDLIVKYRDEIVPEHKAKVSTTHKLNKLMRYSVSCIHLLRLKSADLYKLQKQMQSEGLAPKTVNTYIQLLNQIWTTAKRIWSINLPAQSPFELVSLQKVNNERDRVLTHEEYARLLEKAELSELRMLRDVIVFAYKTGARVMEILSLERKNTDLNKKLATFKDTKNGTDRTIPLENEVVEILKRYPFGDLFFKAKSYDSFSYFFKQARDRAGIHDFKFHDLRACFCTNALLSGMSESEVATISGHLDWRSLKRYSRIKAEDLIEKINKINVVKMSG
jgi:integrase